MFKNTPKWSLSNRGWNAIKFSYEPGKYDKFNQKMIHHINDKENCYRGYLID